MPILPNERGTLHDDTGMLPTPVHRADAYREIGEARRKLDDEREREIQAADTDRTKAACDCCATKLAGCYHMNCADCMERARLEHEITKMKSSHKGEWA